jgi:hypothetical protein
VNARDGAGQTALMLAAVFGRTDAVRPPLANGSNSELRDQVGNMAVSSAKQQSNPQMVALIT